MSNYHTGFGNHFALSLRDAAHGLDDGVETAARGPRSGVAERGQ